MLDTKLKELLRPTLDDHTKSRHLAALKFKYNKSPKKGSLLYVTTLIAFALLSLFLFQITQYEPPSEQQQADVLTVGALSEASYLYSTNATRNYQFPSFFITDELVTTDANLLKQLAILLNGLEKIPYTAKLSDEAGATHYRLKQENGEIVYLKSVYREKGPVLIDVTTNQQIKFSEEIAHGLEKIWLQVHLDHIGVPLWKYIALVGVILLQIIIQKKQNKVIKNQNIWSFVISLALFLSLIYSYLQFTQWYGVRHLLVLLIMMATFLTIDFSIEKAFKRTQQTWKNHLQSIFNGLAFLFIFFV